MRTLMLGTALLAGTVGMVNARQSQTATPHDMAHMMQMMQNCPMHVQGAKVAVADTATGIAVTMTTESSNAGELRRRVELMAKRHEATEDKRPMMRDMMISAGVKYDEIANGARIILTPTDPAQLEELRKQVRAHVERMNKGGCPMMQEMRGGMKHPEPTPKDGNHDSHHPQ